MKHYLRILIFAVFIYPAFLSAQTQNRSNDCPGVPGACGYPVTTNTQRAGDPSPTPQNGNGTLGVIFDMQKCGLDFASASNRMGKRFTPVGVNQPAPFSITGIPACAIIEKAYLWAEGSGNGMAQTATIAGPFGTANFPMAVVGTGPDKCWGYAGTQTYRADVTAIVGGNGVYNISGILTNPPTAGNDMDGATLLVVWSLPTAPWAGRIVIADGAIVVNGGIANYNMPLTPAVCGNTTNARAFFGVGDIQFNPGAWSANGTPVPLTWNWWNFETVNTTVANGANTSNFNVNTGGDCFNLCISGLYFRTTTCTTCPMSTALTVTPSSVPATCSNCNGSASVTVAPAGSYTYSWAPSGGTGSSATGLCPGVYTVTITGSCVVQTQTINVVSSGGSLAVTGTQNNVLCNGMCTGSATSTVTGGTGPYTFTWSPAAANSTVGATNTASGLCAGTYVVNVTDAGGCTGSRTVTITQPPALAATQSQTNILCNGQCTGSASVVASGGTGPYTYAWTPSGGTAATTTGRCVGLYTCTITDANGCTITRTFNITQPTALATTGSQTNILCNGGLTGSAAVVASGGTGPYSYSWAPSGGTGSTATGLGAGTYTVTVTDANGCTSTRSFTITQPTALAATQSQTNILCNGVCTGSAAVVASGGTGPYTYAWTPSGGTAATTTGRCVGLYTCTITDANGCTITRTFNITQPPAITTTGTQTNVLCSGGLTGSASVVASGGTSPYTYSWSPSGGTGATATGLGAGTYVVTVTDANGCTSTRTFTITQPPALAATTSATPATCGNNNGSASVSVSGGTGPYTYSWSPSGGTGATATGLGANTYVVTVTDANGCTLTRTVTVTNAGSPTATITASTNITCFGGANGSATVSVSGGTGPYTYNWTLGNPTGDGTPSVTGLTATSWTCTVTDANGCISIATVTLTQPPALTATATSSPVLCFGGATGSASVTATGGVSPYTYAWAPSGGTGTSATGLGAGTYTVTVTDANGCTTTATTTVTQPTALATTGTQTNVLCNGGLTGSASVVASGGTAGYTYNWAPSGGTGSTATGLGAGTYTVTVTDANGCTITRSFTITQPTPLAATTSFTQATCGSSNGSAAVVVTGGTGPYTYLWSPSGGTGTTATGLAAGVYSVVYTDANGCTGTASVTVPNAGSPTATITATTNVSCFGGNNGSATVAASGGTGPYTYAWAPTGGTGTTGTALIAGNYTVTVTDANGCSTTATTVITQPPAVTASATSTPVLCFGGTTGTASATAGGGVGPYTYNWAPSGGTGASASGLGAGVYTVTITDANGCTATATTTVTQPTTLAATATASPVLCFGGNTGSAAVTASGGTAGYSYNWAPTGGTGSAATGLIAGVYTVTVTDANGCTTTATTTVTQPTALAATTSFTQSTCGNANGSAAVVVTGGTAGYTYSWSPSGGTGATATGLAAGAYSVLYTDANGCTGTATVNVPNAGSPTATITATTNVSCFGGNNGSATVAASGGTGPYTYAWAPTGGTGTTGTALIAGIYTVTVTDANGCSTTATTVITQPPVLTATASSSPVLCFGGTTGSASVTATGGVSPYTYAWAPSGGTGTSATGLGAGTYTVTVTDANGCTTIATTTVTQPTALAATATASPVLCFGGNTGSAAVTASGGTAGYTYNWAPTGGTGSAATGLIAGVYTVTVTDANGCTTTATTTVTEPTALAATTSFTQSTCGNANGAAAVVVTGGTAGYTYSWSPSGGTGASATGLAANTYSCLITDANGCTMTATVAVPNAGSPTATITATTNVSCFGGNNGSATVAASGGTGPYAYAWAPTGGTGTTGNALIAGNYTVTVTDANGCTTTATVLITEPPVLASTATSSPVLCFGGATGSATVTPTGGVSPYTYNWAPSGGTGSTATGLIAGVYTVTVTDANGCTTTATTTVTEPTALASTATASPVLCFGGNTGSAAVTASGGTAGYTYNWAPSGGTGASAAGLIAGVYTVTITDANGCTTTATTTVTQPTALAATTSFTQSTCSAANGAADVVVTGGTPGYTYNWSPSGGTAASATGLIAATYTVVFTDANGCIDSATVVVPNANSPVVTIIASDSVSCFGGNDGFAAASSTGGTSPYTYLWSNADADTLAGNLIVGSYTVTVTDANGCTSTASITIGEPTLLTATASSTDVLCFGGTTGAASATASGGTGSYTYNWAPAGGTASTATGLSAAVYTVTITDANGCTTTATTTVNEPPALAITATFTPVSCFGGADGTTSSTATGGLGAYTYNWTPAGGTGSSATGLIAGIYTITVTDANGCTATATTTVTEPPALAATTSFTQSTCSAANGSADVVVTGGTGAYTYLWSPGGATTSTATGLAANTYSCLITDANGCTLTVTVVVPNANAPVVTIAPPVMVSCFGGNDGSALASSTGGTAPYSYLWNNNDADSLADNLTAGSYTVTVTDANGCTSSATVLVVEPSLLNVQASASPATVCEGTPVQLTANAGGGTPGYTYNWTPGPLAGQTQNITPTVTTTYTVTVTDANGCSATSPVLVTVNPMPAPVLSANFTSGCAPLCVDFSDLSTLASGTIIGWTWDFGDNTTSTQQDPSHCYNTPGNYTVILTVTTAAGCTQTITMANYISVYAMPIAAFGAGPQPSTMVNPEITFTDSSYNASTWFWSFGDLNNSSSTDQNPTFTYSDPECYQVVLTVTSADGCVDTASQIICIGPDVSIYVPNTFTPDDNGLNDEFMPVTIGIDPDEYELWIFDRWGNMIFYSDELDEGWDGRVQGASEICQIDTYVWKIKCKDILNKKYDLIGHVNLIK